MGRTGMTQMILVDLLGPLFFRVFLNFVLSAFLAQRHYILEISNQIMRENTLVSGKMHTSGKSLTPQTDRTGCGKYHLCWRQGGLSDMHQIQRQIQIQYVWCALTLLAYLPHLIEAVKIKVKGERRSE